MYKLFKKNGNKKGSSQDLVLIAVVLLTFAISVLIGFKLYSEINTQVQTMSGIDTHGKTASTNMLGVFTGTVDNMFLFLTIGLSIAALALAALVRVHPIFLVFFIITLILIIFVSGILSEIYDDMAETTALATEANQLTFISLIMTRLPFIIGIVGVLMMIILYKVWDTGT